MVKMTSAYANKLIKQLEEEKSFWTTKEADSQVYQAAMNEEPLIPDYDYVEVSTKIAEIDEKICKIKHAINLHNVTNTVRVEEEDITIDMILVKMAQLNKRKAILNVMRRRQPKSRNDSDRFLPRNNSVPEYQYINYDLELVKQEYEHISERIMKMQMQLDIFNQTHEFEVEL